jgi:hypothetical protein
MDDAIWGWRSDTNKQDLQGFNHERRGSVGIRKQYQPSLWTIQPPSARLVEFAEEVVLDRFHIDENRVLTMGYRVEYSKGSFAISMNERPSTSASPVYDRALLLHGSKRNEVLTVPNENSVRPTSDAIPRGEAESVSRSRPCLSLANEIRRCTLCK